jgi:5'-nucleotidase
MRILIVNDDGVNAPGLAVLEEIAREVAGPEGEIWTVAPELERSGVSHAISYVNPLRLSQFGARRFAVEGYPADCAVMGVHHILADAPPDLVLSGVNSGHNIAEDTVYSGTVGGAMEGALQGFRAIALSQHYSRRETAPEDKFEPARAWGAETVRRLLEAPWEEDLFYNVNFPAVRPQGAPRFAVAPQGRRRGGTFDAVEAASPSGRRFFWLAHRVTDAVAEPGTDVALMHEGFVTVTPMRPDLSARHLFDGAREALER